MMYDGFRPSKAREKNREAGVFKVSSLGIVNENQRFRRPKTPFTYGQKE